MNFCSHKIYIRKLIQVPFIVMSRQTAYAAKSFALLRLFYVPMEAVNLHKVDVKELSLFRVHSLAYANRKQLCAVNFRL